MSGANQESNTHTQRYVEKCLRAQRMGMLDNLSRMVDRDADGFCLPQNFDEVVGREEMSGVWGQFMETGWELGRLLDNPGMVLTSSTVVEGLKVLREDEAGHDVQREERTRQFRQACDNLITQAEEQGVWSEIVWVFNREVEERIEEEMFMRGGELDADKRPMPTIADVV